MYIASSPSRCKLASCRWVSPKGRGKALSTIYAFSSAGTVLGLVVTPPLAQALGGWPPCFWLFAGLGILWAVRTQRAKTMFVKMLGACCHILPSF